MYMLERLLEQKFNLPSSAQRAYVFEGGGDRGRLYPYLIEAAIEAKLCERSLTTPLVAIGASAGGFSALGMTVGLSTTEMKSISQEWPSSRVLKTSALWRRPLTAMARWIGKDGILPSGPILDLAHLMLEEARLPANVTFKRLMDMTGNKLAVVTTAAKRRAGQGRYELCVWSPLHSPNAEVAPAVAAGAMIPYLLPPLLLSHPRIAGGRPTLHMDGGAGDNVPGEQVIKLLPVGGDSWADYTKRVLVFKIDSQEEVDQETAPSEPWTRVGKGAGMKAMAEYWRRELIKEKTVFRHRVVRAITPIKTLDKNVYTEEEMKRWAKEAVERFLAHSR